MTSSSKQRMRIATRMPFGVREADGARHVADGRAFGGARLDGERHLRLVG